MAHVNPIAEIETDIWDDLIRKGMINALKGLSGMIGEEMAVNSMVIEHIPAQAMPDMLGGPENVVIGVYILFDGASHGHLLLAHEPQVAYAMLDILLGRAPRSHRPLTNMERSAIGEMGNITGTFFLNAIADELGVLLNPSPPIILMDMAGAVLDIALTQILQERDRVYVARMEYSIKGTEASGNFIILPNPGLLNLKPSLSRVAG
jgi:chemotaxis protein CheC